MDASGGPQTMTDESMAQLLRLGMNNDGTTFLSLMMLSILIIGVIHAFFFTKDGSMMWPVVVVLMSLGGYFLLG
ncbi:hypothetical protein [Nitrosospira briensis]|uniref:hypothetical protein n=1 Tax=Nitrosospira briensis TaxID=35799 RepID=UPI0008E99FB5|nr:hypothetical protein [Nitrosospira briensis]SFN84914.1 hypothetical protein SAMN05216332_10262 [Nitrosospira briensis]